MQQPIKANRNLHVYTGEDFKGLPFYSERGPVIFEYLERILGVLNRALNEHPRTLAIRLDLRYPSTYTNQRPDKLMSQFIKTLRSYFNTDYNDKLARNGRAHWSSIRYIWCRESTTHSSEHYHLMLFVNRDSYYRLGLYGSEHNSLAAMIRRAWATALGLHVSDSGGALHFPKRCLHHIRERSDSFTEDYANAFYRASYFAKLETKSYGNGYRSFGTSTI